MRRRRTGDPRSLRGGPRSLATCQDALHALGRGDAPRAPAVLVAVPRDLHRALVARSACGLALVRNELDDLEIRFEHRARDRLDVRAHGATNGLRLGRVHTLLEASAGLIADL